MSVSLGEFADRLRQIMPVMIREFMRQQTSIVAKDEITPPQLLILDYLVKNQPVKMTGIAKFMSISTAAATGIIDRLVKAGYVQRALDPSDRRLIKIALTKKGQRAIKDILEHRRAMIMKVFSQLSEKDREDYLRVLTRIKDVLVGLKPK